MQKEGGFTLIEVIASLVLAGIMAAVAGAALVQGVRGFIFVKENIAIAQKAQLGLARINRELTTLTSIDSSSSDTCIRYRWETDSPFLRVITLNNTDIELKTPDGSDRTCGDSSGNVLVDQVGSFTISYENQVGAMLSAPPALIDLYAIHITLSIGRNDGNSPHTFSLAINPRNNGTVNGPSS